MHEIKRFKLLRNATLQGFFRNVKCQSLIKSPKSDGLHEMSFVENHLIKTCENGECNFFCREANPKFGVQPMDDLV